MLDSFWIEDEPFKDPGTSFVLILSLWVKSGDSFFTSAGVSPTFKAFMPLTPFETMLLGMVLFQIFILQLYGIVPFDLNKILHGDYSGMGFTKTARRKRTVPNNQTISEISEVEDRQILALAEKILALILLTDHYDCVPRTLCEVRQQSLANYKPHALFVALFHTFKFFVDERQKNGVFDLGSTSKPFEEAFEIGLQSFYAGVNSTLCEVKYSSCPLTSRDLFTYISDITLQDFT